MFFDFTSGLHERRSEDKYVTLIGLCSCILEGGKVMLLFELAHTHPVILTSMARSTENGKV
jgi:hypothetical protein